MAVWSRKSSSVTYLFDEAHSNKIRTHNHRRIPLSLVNFSNEVDAPMLADWL